MIDRARKANFVFSRSFAIKKTKMNDPKAKRITVSLPTQKYSPNMLNKSDSQTDKSVGW